MSGQACVFCWLFVLAVASTTVSVTGSQASYVALSGRRTVRTQNKYAVCRDECKPRGSSYNSCNAVDGILQQCLPNDYTHAYNFMTESGNKCDGRCLYNVSTTAYCYNTKSKWERCFPDPSYSQWLNVINDKLKSLRCLYDSYETSSNHAKCASSNMNTKHLTRRAADDYINNELYFECDSAVDTVLTRHTLKNPTIVVRQFNPANPITTNPNPILSYTMLPTFSYFSEDGEDGHVDLPLALDALITSHTLLPVNSRDSFTTNVTNNFNKMDRLLTHVNYDERGHILASRLGGPIERFNVFPQAWRMNRGRQSMWFGLEADIDRFLRNNPNRYVRFTAVLSYGTDNNHILVHRPTAIMLRVRAFDNGVQVDLSNGNPVTALKPSTTENMYFSNDPDHSCAPLPAKP